MQTAICDSIIARDNAVIAPCQHLRYFPLVVRSYNGATITDADGNEFIDFLSGAAALNLGGSNPVVMEALEAELRQFTQYTIAYSYNERAVAYAEQLTSVYPGGIPVKVAFGNSGSDSNDAAVKFARAYTGRQKILVFANGYHGSTYGAASMTTCSTKIREGIGPFLPDVYVFPFFGTDIPDDICERECLAELNQAFSSWLPAAEVAAVVIEPVQGDGGILPAHPIFMKKLYALCQENGILFFSEEVQQGFWRTGKWFSIEHYGIVPDGMILGKAAGAGLPLGAFVARREIMDRLPAPAHVFTMSGNAMSCAAGIAAFDYYKTAEFQTALTAHIAILWEEANALMQQYPEVVQFVRGLGMTIGIGIVHTTANGTTQPDPDAAFKLLYRCYEKGLIVISVAGNILRIQPPLTISAGAIRQGFSILRDAIAALCNGQIDDALLCHNGGW